MDWSFTQHMSPTEFVIPRPHYPAHDHILPYNVSIRSLKLAAGEIKDLKQHMADLLFSFANPSDFVQLIACIECSWVIWTTSSRYVYYIH